MADKCVVICSGGLDSTTVAAHAKLIDHCDPILLHFRYRCRAQPREECAVRRIGEALNARTLFWDIEWLKQLGGSRLTSETARIATGVAGAELPHEWVPAGNLLFLAHAAGFC